MKYNEKKLVEFLDNHIGWNYRMFDLVKDSGVCGEMSDKEIDDNMWDINTEIREIAAGNGFRFNSHHHDNTLWGMLEAYIDPVNYRYLLDLYRAYNQEAEGDLSIRAHSNGQSVDFNIHVILHEYVGLNETQVRYKVFPNPTQGQLQLSAGNSKGFEYRIHNLLGQQVRSGRSDEETTSIDLSACPKGIYFVTLNQNGTSYIEKIIIY